MPDSYSGRNLIRYLGSESSAVGFLLFALGAGGLLVSALALAFNFSWQAEPKTLLAVPAWSIVAAPLGLSMRRNAPSTIVFIIARLWLYGALLAMFVSEYTG